MPSKWFTTDDKRTLRDLCGDLDTMIKAGREEIKNGNVTISCLHIAAQMDYKRTVEATVTHIDEQQKLIDRLVGMLAAVLDINTPAAAGISHHVIKTVDGTTSVTYKCIPPGCRVCEIDRQARALLEEVDRGN